MTLQQSISSCFSKYATFQGRAPRSEYWFWLLFVMIAMTILIIIGAIGAAISDSAAVSIIVGIVLFVFLLATILPSIAVAVRRLHDVNRGGGWWWIQLIPYIGFFWYLYFMVQPGTVKDPSPGPNRFGDGLS